MDFRIEWHERLGSTNSYLRERLSTDDHSGNGLVVAAREQTQGRGRLERRWISSPGANLCFSLFLATDAALPKVPSLTMAVALGIADLLQSKGIDARPKWPNDILVADRKICGILSERLENGGRRGVVIGIGLNINMTSDEAGGIDRPATSMLIECGKAHFPPAILEELLPFLGIRIADWKIGGFPLIKDEWIERAGPIGKPLTVHDGDKHKTGRLAGFGENGELLLETVGGVETIWSGDIA